MSPDASDIEEVSADGLLHLAYRLNEESEDQRVAGFYCFVVGASAHVQLAIYFDDEGDVEEAKEIWLNVKEELAGQP